MKCAWEKCTDVATHYPKICVPVGDLPIMLHHPMGITMGVACCKRHTKQFDIHGFLECRTPSGNARNKILFEVLGRRVGGAPDFQRAYIQPVRIESDEAQVLQKANNGPNQPISAPI